MSFRVESTIPVLRIFDEAAARAFYVDWLGFTVAWENRFGPDFPLYMEVARDGLTLHLTGHHGDATPGSSVFLRVRDVRAFHAEITSRPYANLRPGVEETFHNSIQMKLTDPFGNRLLFDESLA
jgi:catechol 2,3-dioxygenase-like lactoylglutathione lyase family enzyme